MKMLNFDEIKNLCTHIAQIASLICRQNLRWRHRDDVESVWRDDGWVDVPIIHQITCK
jgi:hypothetical protein